jgi:glycopeptide antibiotics resistance protein
MTNSRKEYKKNYFRSGFYCYASILFYLVFLIPGRELIRKNSLESRPKLIPFVDKAASMGSHPSISKLLHSGFFWDWAGNIFLFIPFTFLLLLSFPRIGTGKAFLIGAFSSICIEAAQYALVLGTPDIDDVIMNMTGALIGAAAYLVWERNKNRIRLRLEQAEDEAG